MEWRCEMRLAATHLGPRGFRRLISRMRWQGRHGRPLPMPAEGEGFVASVQIPISFLLQHQGLEPSLHGATPRFPSIYFILDPMSV